jgi:dinuclear metal center YbgI/SA1388 family protein
VGTILERLEEHAPGGSAEDWDNVGLLAGDPAWRTSGAVITIDLCERALELARERKDRLIVTHHPCFFHERRETGGFRLVAGAPAALSSLALKALRSGIAVAAVHTNFDRCALEVVRDVSRGLGVVPSGRLFPAGGRELRKLVVFVPSTHLETVREALFRAGAGEIGYYDSCTFGASGEGTFRGQDRTTPFLGKPGRLERAAETRLETVFPRGLQSKVLRALLAAHPYEEVAYDVYEVLQEPLPKGVVSGLGNGFWGEFGSPKAFSDVAKDVKSLFKLGGFLLTGSPPPAVKRIAFVAGKGSSFVPSASDLGCDLFITGEAGHHAALGGAGRGMAVLEIGHLASERFFVRTLEDWISRLGLRSVGVETSAQRYC